MTVLHCLNLSWREVIFNDDCSSSCLQTRCLFRRQLNYTAQDRLLLPLTLPRKVSANHAANLFQTVYKIHISEKKKLQKFRKNLQLTYRCIYILVS